MLDGIIKNNDNSYELLKIIDGKLSATHVSKDGFSKSDSKYIESIFSKMFFNSNCIYLTDENGYSIYYDKETGLRHFLRDSIEDMEMFIRFNGKDSIMYLDDDKKSKGNWMIRTFQISLLSVVIIFGSLDLLCFHNAFSTDEDAIIKRMYSAEDRDNMYDAGPMDYKEAIELINSSDLDDIDKQLLTSEEILKLAFKYYKGTPMEYTANLKFNGLRVEKYNGDEGELEARTLGYYSALTPNVLNIRKDADGDTLVHEFIHLLQADGPSYRYLDESVAALMTTEYYDILSNSYPDAVDNLKLLINIVGPEPILKLVFGGDDTDLLKIFKDNLSPNEVSDLVKELHNAPEGKDSEQYSFVRNSLFKLYENIYGSSVSDNLDLSLLFLSKSEYFNSSYNICYLNIGRVMNTGDEHYFLINDDVNKEILVRLGYLDYRDNNYFKKDIFYQEYVQLDKKDKKNVTFTDNYSLDSLFGCVIQNDCDTTTFYLLDEPVEKDDYLTLEGYDKDLIRKLPGKEILLTEAFEEGYVNAYLRKSGYEITNMEGWSYSDTVFGEEVSNNPNVICENGTVLYCAKSIKLKFSEQYNRISEGVIDNKSVVNVKK